MEESLSRKGPAPPELKSLCVSTCTSYSTSSAAVNIPPTSVPVNFRAGVVLTPVASSLGVPSAVVGDASVKGISIQEAWVVSSPVSVASAPAPPYHMVDV